MTVLTSCPESWGETFRTQCHPRASTPSLASGCAPVFASCKFCADAGSKLAVALHNPVAVTLLDSCAYDIKHGSLGRATSYDLNTIRSWPGHTSLDTPQLYAKVDLAMKANPLGERQTADVEMSTVASDRNPMTFWAGDLTDLNLCGLWKAPAPFAKVLVPRDDTNQRTTQCRRIRITLLGASIAPVIGGLKHFGISASYERFSATKLGTVLGTVYRRRHSKDARMLRLSR
jgi:hypothetical protein